MKWIFPGTPSAGRELKQASTLEEVQTHAMRAEPDSAMEAEQECMERPWSASVTKNYRIGIVSLMVLLAIGRFLPCFVDVKKAARESGNEEAPA